jgi:hypothetical protein
MKNFQRAQVVEAALAKTKTTKKQQPRDASEFV